MANYTSTQSGNFSSPSTWGGSGYPNTAGDTFTVSTGHTVTLDIDNSSILLGASTVNGILMYSSTGTTGLMFNANLTINGTLRIGTNSNPITGLAKLLWALSSDNSAGLIIGTNGILEINGTFTKEYEAKLINDAENLDNDADIIIDNSSSGWQIGDELIIRVKKSGSASIASSGFVYRTIASISGANITLNSAVTIDSGVGNTWVGYVYNITRNIIIGHASPTKSIGTYNTNRPFIRIDDNNLQTHNIDKADFWGVYSFASNGGAASNFLISKVNISNSVFGFGEHFGNNVSNFILINNIIVSCMYGLRVIYNFYVNECKLICLAIPTRSTNNTNINGSILICNNNIYGIDLHQINFNNCKFIANGSSPAFSINLTVENSDFADNLGVFINSSQCTTYINCKFGYDGALQESNINEININGFLAAILKNCVYNESNFPILSSTSNTSYLKNKYFLYIENGNLNNIHKIWQCEGEAVRIVCDDSGTKPSVDINGTNGFAIAITNLQSRLGYQNNSIIAFRENNFLFDLQGQTKTIKIKLQSTFSNVLTSSDVYMVVTYYDTNNNITKAISTNSISPRQSKSDWTQFLSVQIQANLISGIQIYLTKYEAGKELFVGVPVLIE